MEDTMKTKTITLCFIIIVLLLFMVGCSDASPNQNSNVNSNSSNNEQVKTTTKSNSNSSQMEANPNWKSTINTYGISKDIPAFQGKGNISVKTDKDSVSLIIHNNNEDDYNKYLELLDSNGWKLEKKYSDIQSAYSNGTFFLNIDFTYAKEEGAERKEKATIIKITTGEMAKYLIEKINPAADNAVDNNATTKSGYIINKPNITVNISDDNYLKDTENILIQLRTALEEMYSNYEKATTSSAKKQDLKDKIVHYLELVEKNEKLINTGGYKNLLTDELWPEAEQSKRCAKAMDSLVESVLGLVDDFNTAYKYN
jgi:hypothetical protein